MILRFFIPLFFLALHSEVVQAGGLDDFLTHSASTGTQNKLGLNVTNADLPHLPSIHGFMGTHGTFRFMDIKEQTAWIVGEPKHGLWRYQDNGMYHYIVNRSFICLSSKVRYFKNIET